MTLSRRDFLTKFGVAACGFAAGQFYVGPKTHASIIAASNSSGSGIGPNSLANLKLGDLGFPQFDGILLLNPNDIAPMALDFGRTVNRVPRAVLQPAHSRDVLKLAAYCEQNQIKLAVRGTGGAAYGQTLVEDGIVLDSSSLKFINWLSSDVVEVGPGLVWRDFVNATFPLGYVPPVMPDTIVTSVGGTASVGGIGETSFCLGAMTDHIQKIELVTLQGQTVRCDHTNNPDLFWSALGGMGQMGIITSVTMKLRPSPKTVYSADYEYGVTATTNEILADFDRLSELNSKEEVVSAVGGHFNRVGATNNFSYTMHVWSALK